MQRLGLVGLVFLGLCLAIYLVVHAGTGSGGDRERKPERNAALVEIEAIMKLAEHAERAIESANYGDARSQMVSVRKRLNKLVLVVAEQQIDEAHGTH